ncbi:hypothetical protein J5N97_016495 [Dioscorea zingiberensis]|uniref:Uncharacterized protein n=1 Tax=Dioscorea zingiberensis TaxID=325984 RepID=A0A9D5CLV6_9LILI|nr:hypothetical protein J5N97_016495 [Dioscorea zingiberensis]
MASNNSLLLAFFILITLCASMATSSRVFMKHEISMAERHEQWMAKHGKTYKDAAEKLHRFEIFKLNVNFIESFNAGNHKFKLGANRFADLTNDEFKAMYTGFIPARPTNNNAANTSFKYENFTNVPSSVDWRTEGAVTPIKDQGQCGSCWAFSAVAAMEGVTKLSTGNLISLSEQELVDCDVLGDDKGCNGGLMDNAFKFIIVTGGLNSEANYPYTATDDSCNVTEAASHAAAIKGYEDVPKNSEDALLKAVANQPVSVAVDASGIFQLYDSGVLSGDCGTDLDHGVTAVGYGTASDGTKYWLVKNSWGEEWGENGYVRLERDVAAKEGMCGIAMEPSFPTA